ncbi:flavin monoamine oxidase family protein [Nonomuraea pusilla]|uniref:Monoamine oxidase n=1 Tax=Nonomuraea pusilla TaxID=46177 RepID=A0A1H7TDF2_9ACTN|nr:flavin monoamine oxidase family protein [Nonomuraea pusilla]SEL82851.1 monoamine oxidase [Nonomuraea pusilla]
MTDVIVVGAGVAGLVAARDLVARGREVVVLEARDRVGGRTLNADLPGSDGQIVEAGGQWVGPTQDRVAKLITELGLEIFSTYDIGDKIGHLAGRFTRYGGRIPRLNPLALVDLDRTMKRVDRAARRVPLEEPWLAPNAHALDNQTFDEWLRHQAPTSVSRTFMRLLTESVWCAGPEEMSALWAQFYIHSGGGLESLINVTGGAQQDRIVGGSQRIAIQMAAELGDRIRLRSPVREIVQDGAAVRVRTTAGESRARRVIVALPPPLTARISFDPALPADRDQLTQRMPMGWTIKVNVVYDEPFWRAEGLSGQANSDSRPLGAVFDNSPPTSGAGVLVGFFEAKHAAAAAKLDPEARREVVLNELAFYFGPRARDAVTYLEQDWAAEEYSRGCYGAFATPAALTRFGCALRRPVGAIHWAGTETATRWAGYIDGAVESGERAAAEADALLGR